MAIRWEEKTDGLGRKLVYGYLGKWKCFTIKFNFWNSMKIESENYILECYLPGIKNDLGYFKDIESAQKESSLVMNHWIDKSEIKL